MRSSFLTSALLIGAIAVTTGRAQPAKRLWVLQEPDQIVEYDIVTSAVLHTQTVPRRLVEHPGYLTVNAAGQMLFLPPLGTQWTVGEMATAADRAWFWDGRQAIEWKLEGPKTSGASAGAATVADTTRQWLLPAGGTSLFRIEQTSEKILEPSGGERSVRSTAHVWRTNLSGDSREEVTTIANREWCACTTGVCSESCPEWSFWAPNGLADEFFLATRLTPGQTESTYHESVLYRRSGSRWQSTTLPQPIATPRTASKNGDVLVVAVPDGGCCGWENVSSDQLLLLKDRKPLVLYDEARRFGNRNYDVSFYAADARLSGSGAFLAYTLESTAPADSEIRLSEDGTENSSELARVRRTIAALPAVDVVQLEKPPRTVATIPRAGLVGWMSEREILVAENGLLVVYDTRGVKRKNTMIRARSAADAFLR